MSGDPTHHRIHRTDPHRRRAVRGDGSVFKRKSDDRWVAKLSYEGKPKYYYGATKEEAAEKRRLARAILAVGGALPDLAATVDTAVDQYRASGLKPHNLKVRAGRHPEYLDRIAASLGDIAIAYVTEDEVRTRLYEPAWAQLDEQCFVELVETADRFFQYAMAWSFCSRNPAKYRTAMPWAPQPNPA